MMANLNQPFLPQTAVPFTQQSKLLPLINTLTARRDRTLLTVCCCDPAAPQVAPPENHFGQVDVNDLLTKLISTGIIKPSQPEVAPPSSTGQWLVRMPQKCPH